MDFKEGQTVIGPTHGTRFEVVSAGGFGGEVKLREEGSGRVSLWFGGTLAELGYVIEPAEEGEGS